MPITPLPTPPLRSDAAEVFVENADTFMAALPQFAVEANALERTLQIVATTGTSTSSLLIGTGSKSLTTQTGKAWVVGAWLYIVNTANVANYMVGQITTYTSGTGALVVNVTQTAGSGTLAAWTIGLAVPSTTAVTATTATNLASGSTGTVPYQSAAGTTAMVPLGTSTNVLRGGTVPAFVDPFIAGGTAGSVVYQTGANTTAVNTAGTSTQVLSGGATPTFVAPFIAGGTAGSVPYQTGPNATGLTAVGAAGQFLQSTGGGAPVFTSPPSVTGAFKNLKLSASGTNSTVAVTVDELVVSNGAGAYTTLSAVSLAFNGTAAGVPNGLDAGALATNTWYSVWVIWNGTFYGGLLSTSDTAPIPPSGYTFKARVGWIKTDGTANKFPLGFIQQGRDVQYRTAAGSNLTSLPTAVSGVAGSPTTPTWLTVPVRGGVYFAPITACAVAVTLRSASATCAVAPNNTYGASNTGYAPPPICISSASLQGSATYKLRLESSNIYFYSDSTFNLINFGGWEDNL